MKITVVLLMFWSLSACVLHQPAQPNDPYYAPVLKTQPQADTAINGSLYQPNVALSLFDDGKAAQIGDILTVVLQERTSSSKSSNIEIIKESDVSIAPTGLGTILGTTPNVVGGLNLNSAFGGDREFVGEADADQSNRLSGSISVTVTDVFPNGTLVVRGEKWITLNRGSEFIRISGLVRPEDISPDNSLSSTKIANARIAYSGTGELAESQQMGWITRFFNSPIWPF
ncbi:MAG: flagellar basal body L-ring protein FlgH [Agarilytica sp.]